MIMQPYEIEDWKSFLADNGVTGVIDVEEWVMCNCVFHTQSDFTRPSMGINKESGVSNCFGCGSHSWSELCSLFGISEVDFVDGVREKMWQRFKHRIVKDVCRDTFKRYKLPNHIANPMGHKGARKYLVEKQGFDTSILEEYNVRVCTDKDSKYNDCVIFPIEDEKGVLFFDARYVGDIAGSVRWKRPKDCAYWKTYFNWENVKDSKLLCFTEGVPDALKLIQFGLPAIPAKNFSNRQLEMIRSSPVESIYLFYDNDEAGRTAVNKNGKPIHFTAKAKYLFENSGVEVVVGRIPKKYKDPAEVEHSESIYKLNPNLKNFV